MDIGKLRERISMKYVEGQLTTDDGPEILKFPLLTVGDWGELKDKTGVNIWDLLLSVSAGIDEAKIAEKTEAEIEREQRNASVALLKKIDQTTQVVMIYFSLRRAHDNLTPDDVDYIITYGMDQQEYIKIVNFLLYGITSDQVKKLKELSDVKNVKTVKKVRTPSEDAQSVGEESKSSSEDGTESVKK